MTWLVAGAVVEVLDSFAAERRIAVGVVGDIVAVVAGSFVGVVGNFVGVVGSFVEAHRNVAETAVVASSCFVEHRGVAVDSFAVELSAVVGRILVEIVEMIGVTKLAR